MITPPELIETFSFWIYFTILYIIMEILFIKFDNKYLGAVGETYLGFIFTNIAFISISFIVGILIMLIINIFLENTTIMIITITSILGFFIIKYIIFKLTRRFYK